MDVKKLLLINLAIASFLILCILSDRWNLIQKPHYTASDFSILEHISSTDCDQDGIDDAHDLLYGAREYVQSGLKYKSSYYDGGYPTDEYSVCTDVIWYAFQSAGYNLKQMVDDDIVQNTDLYPLNSPDSNIDFRRVRNLKVFFERFAENLTLDIHEIDEWMPGDIVVFSPSHIGIISDKRNKDGIPYLIHHGGQPNKEEDCIIKRDMEITGHYRWK